VSLGKLEHLRALSEALFGQRCRLEVVLVIASSEDGAERLGLVVEHF
jgi:hypothetical protein